MSLLDENGLARVWSKMKTWVGNQLPGDFSGATTASAGTHGLVPAPGTTDTDKFLRGDGSWADGSTDTKVTQTSTTTDANYRILLSGSADDTAHTEGAGKNSKFTVNPSTGAVTFGTRVAGSQVGAHSFAQGTNITASGSRSHAEGSYTIASGYYSHAEGAFTTATKASAHAEGYGTEASGYYSHAEGNGTKATEESAHAEGNYTVASGVYAHVEGTATEASHKSQHVFGEYNLVDASTAAASERGTYVEIVGNGTAPNSRSNARTLDWSGNEVLSGKLTVGAAPTADMDVATKKYVDDAVTAAIAQVLAAQY